MASHTVFRLASGKGIDTLEAYTEPIPAIGQHDVLVKVRSVALNYRDIAIANGEYPLDVKVKVIPGSDMVGEIAQVGASVDDFAVGDHVTSAICTGFFYGTMSLKEHLNVFGGSKDGTMVEFLSIPAHSVIKLPKSTLSLKEWAVIPSTGSTVWNALYGCTALKPGHVVLVLGTGGVSMTALIFAKAAGATVIVTSSSDKKLELVKQEYGADYTINYKTHPEWAAEVMRLTDGHGADHIIENGGVGTIEQSLGAVTRGGTVSLIGFLAKLPDEKMPNVVNLILDKGTIVRGVLVGTKRDLEEVVKFVASRGLKVPVHASFSYNREDIVKAMKLVESGGHLGKVCINLE